MIVSFNAVQHGLRSRRLLPGESQEEYEALIAGACDYFVPQDEVEGEAVRSFAEALWRLRRVAQAEDLHFKKVQAAVLEQRKRRKAEGGHVQLGPNYSQFHPLKYKEGHSLPLSIDGLDLGEETCVVGTSGSYLSNVTAYETSVQRSAFRSLEILEKMRKLRGGGA